jgi:tryptophanyl-tRNA synthetase
MTEKKVLVSGVKPTGRPHLGNYFGAMKQFTDLQESHHEYIFIADLHAMTSMQDGKELKEATYNLLLDYLAIGLDPKLVTFYKQSDIPEVTELSWMFGCLTTMPYLMRAHAFKDSEAKNKEINAGVFNYPLLMAADILLPAADIVPVGKDQKQHVEIARDTAERFNRVYGDTFKLPKEMILENVQTVPGTDGQKMSKSYNNIIPLFAESEEIKTAVMSIVTDSSGDVPTNVYAIHKLFRSEKELSSLYEEKKGKYKELKEALIEDIESFVAPLRKKRKELAKDRDRVLDILAEGRSRVREIVEAKMEEVREKVGLIIE